MNEPRVLYVEDEEDDVFFMRTAFKRVGIEAGFHSVEDGARAINYLAGEENFEDRTQFPLPALILLDLNLPIRSGFEVLEWLRDQPEFKELPVVVFSSSGRLEDRERARKLGATDYLLKPSSSMQFVDLARHLRETWLKPATV